jgi:crossover junction endodeoxyribonuclease RuvC
MPMPQRILGIDPGLQITGYAVIEVASGGLVICEAGVIRSTDKSKAANLEERLVSIYDGLIEVLEQFKPGAAAVEQLYAHYEHPRTAILMGHARGVIMLAAGQKGLPVASYNATSIKKTLTGNGRAGKDQVQRTIQRELNMAKIPEPADVADALAVAICHYHHLRGAGAVVVE